MKKDAIQPTSRFYKILATEGSDEATILLYNYIGEYYEYDEEADRWKMGGVTDIQFLQELNSLAAKHKIIHIRLNSPGGDFYHGNAIMTAIQSCAAEVHTWNDGVCASMAADIWMCGKQRHMAKNALLMIHPAWSFCIGHASDMRDCADQLDKVSNAAIIATAASTGISEDDMRSRYYADYKDHWLTYADAVTDGLVTVTGEEYTAADVPPEIDNMTYKQLVAHFEKRDNPDGPGLLDRVRSMYEKTIAAFSAKGPKPAHNPPSTHNTQDMNLEELKKALADKTIDATAVKTLLESLEPAPGATTEPAPGAGNDNPLAAAITKLTTDFEALKAELVETQKTLEEYGQKPGASKSTPPMPDGDPAAGTDQPDVLKAFNETMAKAAVDGDVKFTPTV